MTEEIMPMNLEQFNLLNYKRYESNTVYDLTNGRKLGNKYDAKAKTIMSGYAKILSFINRAIK